MSVSVLTNYATNPRCATAATNYAAVPGTGGTAAGARNTGVGYYNGEVGFYRVTWSVGTSAVSGGASYTQTGLTAGTTYSADMRVRTVSTTLQDLRLTAQFQNSSSVNVGAAVGGTVLVNVVNNSWLQITVEGLVAPAGADRVVLTVAAHTPGGVAWSAGHTLDVGFVTLVNAATLPSIVPFDGSTVDAASVIYDWTGAAHASTSTATTYIPAMTLTPITTFDPCPRVEIVLQDMAPGQSSWVTLWRTAGGKKRAVRGVRKREIVGSDFYTDYEPPLGRTITYSVEVVSGIQAQVDAPEGNTSVMTDCGVIQDPLVPGTAVPVYGEFGPNGEANLRDNAMKALEYAAEMSIIPIMGSSDPVGIIGQRMLAHGLDMSMATRAAQTAANLRNLLQSASLVLVRPLPGWAAGLPDLCYMAIGNPAEQPVDEAWGGNLIRWQLVGDLVSAPNMDVLVALWTYGDVNALWATYAQAQTAHTLDTYLDIMINPS